MRKKPFATILFLAVLLICTELTNASAKPMINDIRFESPSTTTDLIIFELNGPYLPTGKALPGDNPRIYFDFPDTAPANKVKTSMPADGNFVKQIRYAYHKGTNAKTRVVFDLVANQKIEFKQDFNQNTNTLVITLFLTGTEPEPLAVASSSESGPVEIAPPPEPEPVAVVPPSEPELTVTEKPTQPEAPTEDITKKIQSIEEVSIAVAEEPEEIVPEPEPSVPPQAQDFTPGRLEPVTQEAQPVVAMPETEPEPVPEPAVAPEPAEQEQVQQVASIPPPTKIPVLGTPIEETTVIQPMSEVGIQEEPAIEDSAPVLHAIEFDHKSNRGEIISFKLNGFHPPVVFGIEEDLPRIVCFFKNTNAGDELKDIIATNGRFVKNIKIGKYKNPDNIRVVLELAPGNNYDLQQIFFKDDKIFMMIVNKTEKRLSTKSN